MVTNSTDKIYDYWVLKDILYSCNNNELSNKDKIEKIRVMCESQLENCKKRLKEKREFNAKRVIPEIDEICK